MTSKYAGSKEELRALNAFIGLSRAQAAVSKAISSSLQSKKLSTCQFGVLEALFHLGPLSQKALSEKLLVTAGNMTCVIDNLERDGLVLRQRDSEDRRRLKISLTSTGRNTLKTVLPKHVAEIFESFSVLTAKEQELLFQLCKKLGKNQKEEKVK